MTNLAEADITKMAHAKVLQMEQTDSDGVRSFTVVAGHSRESVAKWLARNMVEGDAGRITFTTSLTMTLPTSGELEALGAVFGASKTFLRFVTTSLTDVVRTGFATLGTQMSIRVARLIDRIVFPQTTYHLVLPAKGPFLHLE